MVEEHGTMIRPFVCRLCCFCILSACPLNRVVIFLMLSCSSTMAITGPSSHYKLGSLSDQPPVIDESFGRPLSTSKSKTARRVSTIADRSITPRPVVLKRASRCVSPVKPYASLSASAVVETTSSQPCVLDGSLPAVTRSGRPSSCRPPLCRKRCSRSQQLVDFQCQKSQNPEALLVWNLVHHLRRGNSGIDYDPSSGWHDLLELLESPHSKLASLGCSLQQVYDVVRKDISARLELRCPGPGMPVQIRASEGHYICMPSLTDEALYGPHLTTELLPRALYHGSDLCNVEHIMRFGILPIFRHYVHLYASLEEVQHHFVIIAVDPLAVDLRFFKSHNGCYLTRGDSLRRIPPTCIMGYSQTDGESWTIPHHRQSLFD